MSPQEIAAVLRHYELREITSVRPYLRGSSRSPKAKVTSSDGLYILKRYAPSRTELQGLRFQHQLIRDLRSAGLPVVELVSTSEHQTLVQLDGHHYELMRWIDGTRFGYTPGQAKACGAVLAGLHQCASQHGEKAPVRLGFHDRKDVAAVLRSMHDSAPNASASIFEPLQFALDHASRRVGPMWQNLPRTVTHGDWHPGNVMMREDRVRGVIDFESVRFEPRVADLAYGLLQFSLERPSGAEVSKWPTAPNLSLVAAFAMGYQLVAKAPLSHEEQSAIPSLMSEALAVESVLALHKKGGIRKKPAAVVLPWVNDRLIWLMSNADQIHASVNAKPTGLH